MSPTLSKLTLVILFGALAAIVVFRPEYLSDQNHFLRDFINHEYLNILGVVLAITLASLSQLHLSLSRFTGRISADNLLRIKGEIRSSAVWLLSLFVFGFLLVLIKPIISCGGLSDAIINALCIFIVGFYILVMSDITLSVFDLDVDQKSVSNDQP